MQQQHEIVHQTSLLNSDGTLTEPGWARHPYFVYRRDLVKGGPISRKEWDYYAIVNPKKGYWVCLTFSDLGYAALFALAFVDLRSGKASQCDTVKLLSMHKTGLSTSSTHDSSTSYLDKDGKITLTFIKHGEKRHIIFNSPSLTLPDGRKGLLGDFTLLQPMAKESISIATSWAEDRKAFYLNEKVVGMELSEGFMRLGLDKDDLAEDGALGILDWGRGRWTRKNTWHWAACTGRLDGHILGFNLGYGFSDRSIASENAFFVDDRLVKLGQVTFHYDEADLMRPWTIDDDEGRLQLTFTPQAPRTSLFNLGIIVSDQKQIFGTFSGTAVDDDGSAIAIDALPGFAERVYNKW